MIYDQPGLCSTCVIYPNFSKSSLKNGALRLEITVWDLENYISEMLHLFKKLF